MYRPKNLMFQEGGPMESQQMEQPGQEQQIMQMVAQALQQGTPPEQVMQMLIEQGVPQEQAQMIIQEVMSQMQGQMSLQQPTNVQEDQPMMQIGGAIRGLFDGIPSQRKQMKWQHQENMAKYSNPSYFSSGNNMANWSQNQLNAYDFKLPFGVESNDPLWGNKPLYKKGGMRPKGLSYDY